MPLFFVCSRNVKKGFDGKTGVIAEKCISDILFDIEINGVSFPSRHETDWYNQDYYGGMADHENNAQYSFMTILKYASCAYSSTTWLFVLSKYIKSLYVVAFTPLPGNGTFIIKIIIEFSLISFALLLELCPVWGTPISIDVLDALPALQSPGKGIP